LKYIITILTFDKILLLIGASMIIGGYFATEYLLSIGRLVIIDYDVMSNTLEGFASEVTFILGFPVVIAGAIMFLIKKRKKQSIQSAKG